MSTLQTIFFAALKFVVVLSSMISGFILSAFVLFQNAVVPTEVDSAVGGDWTKLLLGSLGCLVLALLVAFYFKKRYELMQNKFEGAQDKMQDLYKQQWERAEKAKSDLQQQLEIEKAKNL